MAADRPIPERPVREQTPSSSRRRLHWPRAVATRIPKPLPHHIARWMSLLRRIASLRLVRGIARRPRLALALGVALSAGTAALIHWTGPSREPTSHEDIPEWAFDEIEVHPLPDNSTARFRPRLTADDAPPPNSNRSDDAHRNSRSGPSAASFRVRANEASAEGQAQTVSARQERGPHPDDGPRSAAWLTGTIEEPADGAAAQVRANFFSRR